MKNKKGDYYYGKNHQRYFDCRLLANQPQRT